LHSSLSGTAARKRSGGTSVQVVQVSPPPYKWSPEIANEAPQQVSTRAGQMTRADQTAPGGDWKAAGHSKNETKSPVQASRGVDAFGGATRSAAHTVS